ncbi:TetR/AcrR family transcriptional regulator [Pseudonocardia eucalypti]|uniref:TetR/AcrR family transcriptional regulator n=1 Tax=Pseudonocardia eucalypti TaxID=648755 RepID=A0ABP9PZ40_9PSEU|nr:AcrR family transcriptional regulator [Pseudonocardia eucalypti]
MDTDRRLVAVAERLFAERGVGAVSLRAVMQAAGTNVAAVHYHFGSKQGLLDAVLRGRADQVSSGRDSLLARLSGADVTPRDLAEAFVRPVVAVLDDGGGYWVRLVGQMLATGDDGLAAIAGSFAERNADFVERLERLSPGVAPATLHFRMVQAMHLTLHVLGDVGRTQRLLNHAEHPWNADDVVSHLVDVVTAIFAGPPDRS